MNLSSKNYQAWTVKAEDYPLQGTSRQQISYFLSLGILAPSIHNTQPWKIKFTTDTELEVSPDWSRVLPFSDTSRRGIFMSLGCYVMNVLAASARFGWKAEYGVDGTDLNNTHVKLVFSKGSSEYARNLFDGISKRQSHKLFFAEKPVPSAVLREISKIEHGDASVVTTSDRQSLLAVSDLHLSAMLSFTNNPKFSREVSSWMRGSNTKQSDGMPGFTFGMPNAPSLLIKLITRLSPKSVKVVGKKDAAVLSKVSAMGVVVVGHDSAKSWVDAGVTYQHVGLEMASKDLFLAPKAACIESGRGAELMKIFEAKGSPQLYFGIGYSDNIVRHSPRRGLEQIIEKG